MALIGHHHRQPVEKYIAKKPSEYTRAYAHQDGGKIGKIVGQRKRGAARGEKSQPDGIKPHEKPLMQFVLKVP